MLAAEAAYCALEDDLQHYLDTYESTHDYDEYHFDLDEIEHDPYVLLSLLCALHEGQWTIDEVQGTLQMLFDRQYILTVSHGNRHMDGRGRQLPYGHLSGALRLLHLYGHAAEL